MLKHREDIFADYFQFYLEDENRHPNNDDIDWNDDNLSDLLVVADGLIAVGTVRNMTVPVTVEFHDDKPEEYLQELMNDADQVMECSIEIKSGKVVLMGCTDYYPDATRLAISPAVYEARVYYFDLDTLTNNGLDGEDAYQIILFPGRSIPKNSLKKRKTKS